MTSIRTVSISPGVSILSVLRHLNYKPWFALAEFVDNALQSFLARRQELIALHGPGVKVRIAIEIHDGPPGRVVIRDNAGGITAADYPRAFRPAAIPTDRTGLSEFGMGMKSAACWFAPRWRVRTTGLGEPVQRTIAFDIERIVNDDISELAIQEHTAGVYEHFTEIILEDLYRRPAGRTLGKIREHLTDIYRVFVRDGTLDLLLDGRALHYEDPEVLCAPYFRETDGPAVLWRKDIEFDLGQDQKVHGFAAIRAVGSTARAGFALFRRGRLIQGSGDEGYRPDLIFGNTNSYRYQRLSGELHLEGFEVSHTKDGFRWDDNEQPFLELLKEHLDQDDLPLLRQAEGYRVRATRDQLSRAADQAATSTTEALAHGLPRAFEILEEMTPSEEPPPPPPELPAQPTLTSRTIETRFRGEPWRITIELSYDADDDWLQISDRPALASAGEPRALGLRVSLGHPFMVRFAGSDPEDIAALLRVAAALGLSEVVTRDAGFRGSSVFLQNINDIVREALYQP